MFDKSDVLEEKEPVEKNAAAVAAVMISRRGRL